MAFRDGLVSFLRRYGLPLSLLVIAIFWQIFVLPSAFPPSHYDALGVKMYCSIEEVKDAYVKLMAKWDSGVDVPNVDHFLKVRYAFELLNNPIWKRDYDLFSVEEQRHIIGKVKQQYAGESFSKVEIPILNLPSSDLIDYVPDDLMAKDFIAKLGDTGNWLIQVYSSGSSRCAEFSRNWKLIAGWLEGVSRTGSVELREVELAAYLADRRKFTGRPVFENGLPYIVAFPHNCRSSSCLLRYQGELSVDAIVDWMATDILGLPRIFYYSKDSLVKDFFRKAGPHKVKVIFFSKTGERAAPFLRQTAKDYWSYASFAFVLWREEESSIWWNMFEVDFAPAVVFVRDPGVKPLVIHGVLNSSSFSKIMEQYKNQVLPQIRNINSMELGCDARGYSRAGNDTSTWYCVILAGRPSLELNNMRQTMRKIQDILSEDDLPEVAGLGRLSVSPIVVKAYREQRLTFAWVDGEAQSKYCFFYLFSEHSYETCGPKRYGDEEDVPRLFIVRYNRNSTSDDAQVEKYKGTMLSMFKEGEIGLASQLVARHNGSANIPEILEWVAEIVTNGDAGDLPYYVHNKEGGSNSTEKDKDGGKGSGGAMREQHEQQNLNTEIEPEDAHQWVSPDSDAE
ncbi:uncharacterized protein LOC116248013 isoform X2 [Nymphaea colorata]|nr:uncharacterized protein LOC116248013 isoform X2 [Nymphaea colorata]